MEPKDLNDGVEEAGNENNVKDFLIVILKRKNEEILWFKDPIPPSLVL